MKEIKIYIAGKIGNGVLPTQGQINAASPKFEAAEKELLKMGYKPINPLKLGFTKLMKYPDILNVCLTIIQHQTHGVLMLRGWEESVGASKEHETALRQGVPVYYESKGGLHDLDFEAKYKYELQNQEA